MSNNSHFVAGVLDSVPGGILAVDNAGRITCLNRGFAAIFNLAAAEWMHRPLAELAQHLQSVIFCAEDRFDFSSSQPDTCKSRELMLTRGDSTIYLREDSGPLQDAAGAIVGRVF